MKKTNLTHPELFDGCPELPEGYYYRIKRDNEPMSIFDYKVSIMESRRFKDRVVDTVYRIADDFSSPQKMIVHAAEFLVRRSETNMARKANTDKFIRNIGF